MIAVQQQHNHRPQPTTQSPPQIVVNKRVTALAHRTLQIFFDGIIANPNGYNFTANPSPSALSVFPVIWNNMMRLLGKYPVPRQNVAHACGVKNFRDLTSNSPLGKLLRYQLDNERDFEGVTRPQLEKAQNAPTSNKPFLPGQVIKKAPTINPTRAHNAATTVMNATLTFILRNSYVITLDSRVRNNSGQLVDKYTKDVFPKECKDRIIAIALNQTNSPNQEVLIIDIDKLRSAKMTYDDVVKADVRKYTKAEFETGINKVLLKGYSSKNSQLFELCFLLTIKLTDPKVPTGLLNINTNIELHSHTCKNMSDAERANFMKKMFRIEGPWNKAYSVAIKH